jgi:hypothetical protein
MSLGALPEALGSLPDVLSSSLSVDIGVLGVSLRELLQLIDRVPTLRKARIISVSTYVERKLAVSRHRCLVLRFQEDGRTDRWLRLDRRTTGGSVNLAKGSGKTPANDEVPIISVYRM